MRTVFDPPVVHDREAPADAAASLTAVATHRALCCADDSGALAAGRGSRRRRLWELDSHAHCPVVGLCLPVAVLRRLMQRRAADVPDADYELHSQAVGSSRRRNPVSEALQRELDQRHALALRAVAAMKGADTLCAWWHTQREGAHMASALWAVLTHARCTPELEDLVLGQVHMQQHEVGQMARALAERQQQLQAQQVRLERGHAAMAARLEHNGRAHAIERERLQGETVRLRGVVLAREARIGQLECELADARQARPDLPARQVLSQQLSAQLQRLRELQRAHERALEDNVRLRGALAEASTRQAAAVAAVAEPAGAAFDLRARSVLCVGGRTGAVPLYRQVVESAGGQFMHHDGGEEDNLQRLENTLAAADLVVCQTGCISHDAYWRVKDHCRRTGKRCVFVEQPSASSLQRALGAIVPTAAAVEAAP